MFHYSRYLSVLILAIHLMTASSLDPSRLNAGQLDPSFGDNGRVITEIESVPAEALIQSGEKILVASTLWRDNITNTDILLVRYQADGRLDESFGTGGQVVTNILPGAGDGASAMAIQPDGKIVVADGRNILVRYLPNGALDPSFDQDGIVVNDFGYGESIGVIKILPGGRILTVGLSELRIYTNLLVLARFLPDGRLDTSFGDEGKITWGEFGFSGGIYPVGAHLLGDGRLLVGGNVWYKQGSSGTRFWQFMPDGSLDESFGSQGMVYFIHTSTPSFTLQADGKIVAAGGHTLMRLSPDGSLDPSFGQNGIVTQDIGEANDIRYQIDGKLLVAGTTWPADPSLKDFVLQRYLPDGSIDHSFGSDGSVITDMMLYDSGRILQLYPDGRILAVGATLDSEGRQYICMARYLNDPIVLPERMWLPLIWN